MRWLFMEIKNKKYTFRRKNAYFFNFLEKHFILLIKA